MHNVWVRLNGVVFFGLTVLLALSVLSAFSTYLHTGTPTLQKLRMSQLKSLRRHNNVERALMHLDIKADLRPAFHWNLKQLFVFVVAEYTTPTNPLNQVILWDRIIESPQDALLNEENVFVKYALIDYGSDLRNNNITLRLVWDHMPLTGRLYSDSLVGSSFVLPGTYQN